MEDNMRQVIIMTMLAIGAMTAFLSCPAQGPIRGVYPGQGMRARHAGKL